MLDAKWVNFNVTLLSILVSSIITAARERMAMRRYHIASVMFQELSLMPMEARAWLRRPCCVHGISGLMLVWV